MHASIYVRLHSTCHSQQVLWIVAVLHAHLAQKHDQRACACLSLPFSRTHHPLALLVTPSSVYFLEPPTYLLHPTNPPPVSFSPSQPPPQPPPPQPQPPLKPPTNHIHQHRSRRQQPRHRPWYCPPQDDSPHHNGTGWRVVPQLHGQRVWSPRVD